MGDRLALPQLLMVFWLGKGFRDRSAHLPLCPSRLGAFRCGA